MMIKYCLYVREDLAMLKNDFFDKADLNGMKSDTYMYKDLKVFLNDHDIDLNTQYINRPEESHVILCLNETQFFVNYKRNSCNKHVVLILTEPPVYNSVDWTYTRHSFFDRVFTYDSDLVKQDPLKYVHINFPIDFNFNPFSFLPTEQEFNEKRLSSLVAGAIAITKGPLEKKSLLFERYRILKWYNKYHSSGLDFYSRTSPLNKFECFRGASIINKISKGLTSAIARFLFTKRIALVYKGAIPSLSKTEVLSSYKFNFCIENSYGINGLISEKIFDCFIGKTIPVYFGAPDIELYIPKNCFIRYEDFKSLKDLDVFLTKMDYKTYLQYLENASDFLTAAKDVFSTKAFVARIYNEIKV